MSQALLTAGAIGALSMAYKLGSITSLVLGRAAEGAFSSVVSAAMYRNEGHGNGSVQYIGRHSVQYILMEMDVEAKVACAKMLVTSIQESRRDTKDSLESDYIGVSLNNLAQIMEQMMNTLYKIYGELDAHTKRWLSSWRTPSVDEDLELLRTQCKIFDSRLDTLIKCLGVHLKNNQDDKEKQSIFSSLAALGFSSEKGKEKMELYATTATSREYIHADSTIFHDSVIL